MDQRCRPAGTLPHSHRWKRHATQCSTAPSYYRLAAECWQRNKLSQTQSNMGCGLARIVPSSPLNLQYYEQRGSSSSTIVLSGKLIWKPSFSPTPLLQLSITAPSEAHMSCNNRHTGTHVGNSQAGGDGG